jgi:hypothetical protein
MATIMGKKVATANRVNSRRTAIAKSNAIGPCAPRKASTREAVRAWSVLPAGTCNDTSSTRTPSSPGRMM